MKEVDTDPSMRRQPGGPVVLGVGGGVARALGFRFARQVAGPRTEKPIGYEVLTEPQSSAND